MTEIEVTNSSDVVNETVEIVLKTYEERQSALSQKMQQKADLVKKLSTQQTVSQNLKQQIECQKKAFQKKYECHVDTIMELQNTISDLNERRDLVMKTINELQEQNENLTEDVEAQKAITNFDRTQITMLRKQVLQKFTEADRLQEEVFNYSDLNDNTFSCSSLKPGSDGSIADLENFDGCPAEATFQETDEIRQAVLFISENNDRIVSLRGSSTDDKSVIDIDQLPKPDYSSENLSTQKRKRMASSYTREQFKQRKLTFSSSPMKSGQCDEAFECEPLQKLCGLKYEKRSHLAMYANTKSQFECVKCGKKCVDKRSLANHKFRFHKPELKCPQCDKYKTVTNLRSHIKNVHEGKKFECAYCQKRFAQKCHLLKHIKSCKLTNGEKKF